MLVKEFLEKIGLGYDDLPPTIYFDFIDTLDWNNFSITDLNNTVFESITIDKENKKIIFK